MSNVIQFPKNGRTEDAAEAARVTDAANAFLHEASRLAQGGMSPSEVFNALLIASARVLTQSASDAEAARVGSMIGDHFRSLVERMPPVDRS